MPLPLIPIVLVLGATAAYKVHKKNAAMTPQRKMILDTALNKKLSSADYIKLADTFDAQGLKAEGTLLRNRAAMQDAPEEKKAQWRAAFKKGFMSEDPAAVLKLAAAFKAQGATGAAADLEKYAQGLKDGTAAPMTPSQVAPSGNGGPSIVTTPPAIIPVPAATPTASANTTATPTVPTTTGTTQTTGDNTSSMSQGTPAPAVPQPTSPAATPATAPSTVAAVPASITPAIASAAAANIALASQLQTNLDAAVGVPSSANVATPTVTLSTGSVGGGTSDQTSSMNQGTPAA